MDTMDTIEDRLKQQPDIKVFQRCGYDQNKYAFMKGNSSKTIYIVGEKGKDELHGMLGKGWNEIKKEKAISDFGNLTITIID